MFLFSSIFGSKSDKTLRAYSEVIASIGALEPQLQTLSDQELQAKTNTFRQRVGNGESLETILPEAFALVREAAHRTLHLRHFDVQLVGGVVLHKSSIAEMRTGEGKTLVATLPTYLNALEGKGVHIITVNDYLARRDSVWMGQVYATLGLSVACINHESSFLYDPTHTEKDTERDQVGEYKIVYEFLRPCSRKEAYAADITYGTNSEFGFDYLRDHLAQHAGQVTQRGHNYAIVDEVDSILIDEARTPLIISAPVAESESLYGTFASIANKLIEGTDYTVDEKQKAIQMTEAGIDVAERVLGVENIYTEGGIKYVHHLETSVRAKALFKREREYVVKDGEVIIVDESTGRLQPGRRWSEGLHQAIEAKEGVKVKEESRTYATITYQNYFRMYQKLSGMTGTAVTSAEEFGKVYGLEVIQIPTNRPSTRADHTDLVFQSELGKFKAIAQKVQEINRCGQPVLIGTVSIEKNELLSEFLKREGVRHTILNAKNHEREGEIVADAGKKSAVTLATNMAGRGVDIKLGGTNATPEEHEEVKSLGGLYVLGTERHEARRIDNQLRGRSGRQGDPGETQFFVSLEDSLMRIFGSDKVKNMMGRFGIPEDQPIESGLVARSIESAQIKVEGLHFDARKHVLEYDDVMNVQRKTIYERRQTLLFANSEGIEAELSEIVAEDESAQKIVEGKIAQLGKEAFLSGARSLILQVIDMLWVEHLDAMEYLRGSVRLRAYGQRDPLVEFRREGRQLYQQLEMSITETVIRLLPNVGGIAGAKEERNLREIQEGAESIVAQGTAHSGRSAFTKATVGRNDPCPCGSGLKYKRCGLINAPEHKK